MIVLAAVLGFLIGWLLHTAADYLPRFAVDDQPQPAAGTAAQRSPAVLRVILDRRADTRGDLLLAAGVEILSAVGGVYLYLQSGLSANWLLSAMIYGFLLLIAIMDFKYRLVLNVLTYPAMIGAVILQIGLLRHPPLTVFLGGIFAFGIFFAVAWLKPDQLGGGDIKLAALIGLALGFPNVLWALLVGAGTAGVVTVILLLTRRAGLKTTIPYAPFLCLGAIAVIIINPMWITV